MYRCIICIVLWPGRVGRHKASSPIGSTGGAVIGQSIDLTPQCLLGGVSDRGRATEDLDSDTFS